MPTKTGKSIADLVAKLTGLVSRLIDLVTDLVTKLDNVAPRSEIDPEAIYTYSDAAELLRMEERPLKELVYAGRIGHVEINATTWRLRGRHLLDYLARNERPAVRR